MFGYRGLTEGLKSCWIFAWLLSGFLFESKLLLTKRTAGPIISTFARAGTF